MFLAPVVFILYAKDVLTQIYIRNLVKESKSNVLNTIVKESLKKVP